MPYAPRPTLLRTWPAMAAAIATVAGMTSCVATVMPLSLLGAPLLGAGIAALIFSYLLALSAAAPDEREQRDRVHFAAAIAWIVSVATGWLFAHGLHRGADEGSRMYNRGLGQVTIVGGVLLGIVVAKIVARIGMAQYRRQVAAPAGSTIAQRMGVEHLLRRSTPAERAGRRRAPASIAATVASVAALGFLGHLLASYWMLTGLAPRSPRTHWIAIVVGMLLGIVLGEVLSISRHARPVALVADPEDRYSAQG